MELIFWILSFILAFSSTWSIWFSVVRSGDIQAALCVFVYTGTEHSLSSYYLQKKQIHTSFQRLYLFLHAKCDHLCWSIQSRFSWRLKTRANDTGTSGHQTVRQYDVFPVQVIRRKILSRIQQATYVTIHQLARFGAIIQGIKRLH